MDGGLLSGSSSVVGGRSFSDEFSTTAKNMISVLLTNGPGMTSFRAVSAGCQGKIDEEFCPELCELLYCDITIKNM